MNCVPYKNARISDITQTFWHTQSDGNPHTGVDWCPKNPWATYLVSPCNGIVEDIRTDENFYDEFWASFQRGYGIVIKDDDDQSYNLYWHCIQVFPVYKGQRVSKGKTVIAQIGNSGLCYANGVEPKPEDKIKPPFPGTHLHQERYHFDEHYNKIYYDPLMFTDFSILVQPNMWDYMKNILINMIKLVKGR